MISYSASKVCFQSAEKSQEGIFTQVKPKWVKMNRCSPNILRSSVMWTAGNNGMKPMSVALILCNKLSNPYAFPMCSVDAVHVLVIKVYM